jgi:hypothetical protein
LLTRKVLKDLQARKIQRLLVRSPLAGGPPVEGGVYAYDAGVRERGGLPPVGDFVGLTAANAIGEPISQNMISSKHTGGVAGQGRMQAGFPVLDQMVSVPKESPNWAIHAPKDGVVAKVEAAAQGGHYVTIGDESHYIPIDQGVSVRPGQAIEAGDVLSDGLPNPAMVVLHKGLGEGRRHFVEQFRKVAENSNFTLHRRNLELLARGLIDHVRLDEEVGDWVPGDVVPYSTLAAAYRPRSGHELQSPSRAVGMYLEQPVLHYAIGDRLKPSMAKELEHFGVNNVVVHPEPPPFHAEMIRSQDLLLHDPDWMTRFLGSNLERSLLTGVHRGHTADESSTSFVPVLARGVDLGKKGPTRGWDPKELKPVNLGEA